MSTQTVSPGDYSICMKSSALNKNTHQEVVTGNGSGASGVLTMQQSILDSIVTIIRNRVDPDYSLGTPDPDPTYLFHVPNGVTPTQATLPSKALLIDYLSKGASVPGETEITDASFVRLVTHISNESWQLFRCVSETIDNTETSGELCPEAGVGRLKKSVCTCVFNVDVIVY